MLRRHVLFCACGRTTIHRRDAAKHWMSCCCPNYSHGHDWFECGSRGPDGPSSLQPAGGCSPTAEAEATLNSSKPPELEATPLVIAAHAQLREMPDAVELYQLSPCQQLQDRGDGAPSGLRSVIRCLAGALHYSGDSFVCMKAHSVKQQERAHRLWHYDDVAV